MITALIKSPDTATQGAASQPILTIVVPTYEEQGNIRPLVGLIDRALPGTAWEVLFVDDASGDGTANEVRRLGQEDPRVGLLNRIGRRGLSSACVEGVLSSQAPFVAIMDADLQHDETLLPAMLAALRSDPALDLVVGSRNVAGGSAGRGLSRVRRWGSGRATALARTSLRLSVGDPMSGFFMVRRASFNQVALDLQRHGFKLLADMISASRGGWKILELPYTFRARQFGTSKMDTGVTLEYLGLIVARLTGGMLPVRLILFLGVGASGLVVQLVMVRLGLLFEPRHFGIAQTLAVAVAMTSNYVLNNRVTYRDRRLRGLAFWRGLASFYLVCSVGALANIGLATALFAALPNWGLASLAGAVAGASWNFWASLIVTWRAR